MVKQDSREKYVQKMKKLKLKKICVWCDEADHDKIKNTARLSRNRKMRVK